MTVYALRLANAADTAARVRHGDLLLMAPGASALTAAGGIRPDGGGVVTITNGTMTVNVAPFAAFIPGGVSTTQGGYPFISDATVALTVDPGHATLPRVDVVCAVVHENAFDASGLTDADVVLVKGTAGAGAPALPTNSLPLRNINVPAGASAGTGGLTSGNLSTDRRTYLRTLGGTIPVASQAAQDALTGNAGDAAYRTDLGRLDIWDGAAWRSYDSANSKAVNRFVASSFTFAASTSYAVIPDAGERTACQMSFTKRRSDTKLVLDLRGLAGLNDSSGTNSAAARLGLRVNGTDVDVAAMHASGAGGPNYNIGGFAGVAELTGVAAGTFTIEPVAKFAGVGAWNLLFSTWAHLSFSVREVSV